MEFFEDEIKMLSYYYLEKRFSRLPSWFPGNRWIKRPNQAQKRLNRKWWFVIAAVNAVFLCIEWNKHG